MSAWWFFVFVVVFQTWEKAIELCKELAEQYQSYLYDYMKLANILVCIFEWGWVSYEELWRSRRVRPRRITPKRQQIAHFEIHVPLGVIGIWI